MLSFRQFLAILQGRRWEVIGVWLALVLCVGIGTMLLPKRYTATAALVVDVKAPELFNSTNSLNAAWVPSYVAMQVDVLTSELVARKAIDALGLDRDPQWRKAWLEETEGQGDLHAWLAAELRKKLEVKASLQSNAIYIGYTGASPQLAAAVTNAIVRGYINATVEMRARPTRQFTDFFDSRAKKLREDLEEAQARLSAYQREHGILAKDERLDAETARLNELNLQLIALQAQVAESASRRELAVADPAHSPEVLGNAMVAGLTADLNRHQARLQELTTRLGDEHPQVLETRASIAEVRRRIAAVSTQVSSSVASTETVNRSRLARLESSLAEQRAKVMKLKEVRDKVDVLGRDVESAQKAYDMVLARASQTDLESQNTQTNVSVIKLASEPVKPSSPSLRLNLAVAFVVGLMVAAGIAVLREVVDRRVRTREDIVAGLQVVMLGELVDTATTARRWLPPPRPGTALSNG
jgi:chain length determinant protein EpsF